MTPLDPRTRLALGIMGIAAVMITADPMTLLFEFGTILIILHLLGLGRPWLHSLRLSVTMVVLIFLVTTVSFSPGEAALLALRLINLLSVSFLLFHAISAEEMGDALRKLGVPYEFAFILTTAMRYVPLIGQKIRSIIDAQTSRGIDLRFRLKNLGNLAAILMPLLVQSFLLSEHLAIAMESRGFGRKGRSMRREYRLRIWEYTLMAGGLCLLLALAWWERGSPM
jgi:energy-coupling factor transport system permease protein